jgi:hypothetical protein
VKNGVLSVVAGRSECDRTGVFGRDEGLLGVEMSDVDCSQGFGESSAGVTAIEGTSDDSGVGNIGGVRREDRTGSGLDIFLASGVVSSASSSTSLMVSSSAAC